MLEGAKKKERRRAKKELKKKKKREKKRGKKKRRSGNFEKSFFSFFFILFIFLLQTQFELGTTALTKITRLLRKKKTPTALLGPRSVSDQKVHSRWAGSLLGRLRRERGVP